jgi:mobilome CxxCx(11)CxxC protein
LKASRRKLRLLTFLGIAVPAVIGGLALSYGAGWDVLPLLIIIGSGLGVLQLVVSIWAAVAGWSDESEFLAVSVAENHTLFRKFRSLGRAASTADPTVLGAKFDTWTATDDARRQQDHRFPLSDKEKCKGMRAGQGTAA